MLVVHVDSLEKRQLKGRTFVMPIEPPRARTMTQVVAWFVPGHAPGHIHDPEEEVFYIVEGEGEAWIDGTPYSLRPGTVIHTPTGVEHNLHVTSPEAIRLIGTFCPPVVPGSYQNLPPRSRDLTSPPNARAKFIRYADEIPGIQRDGHRVRELMRTERMSVDLVTYGVGSSVSVAPEGEELAVHFVRGSGLVKGAESYTPGTVCLVQRGETLVIDPEVETEALEVTTPLRTHDR